LQTLPVVMHKRGPQGVRGSVGVNDEGGSKIGEKKAEGGGEGDFKSIKSFLLGVAPLEELIISYLLLLVKSVRGRSMPE
jgi:hypothetical protein